MTGAGSAHITVLCGELSGLDRVHAGIGNRHGDKNYIGAPRAALALGLVAASSAGLSLMIRRCNGRAVTTKKQSMSLNTDNNVARKF